MKSWINKLLALLVLSLLLAGCAAVAGGGISSILAAVMAAMMLMSCSEMKNKDNPDAVATTSTGTSDGTTTGTEECADGNWETCCTSEGEIDQCCCPEGVACNFGMFTTCNDGSCANDPDECPADIDVTEADTDEPKDVVETADTKEPEDVTEKDEGPACDGQWENCCKDEKVDQCCCPEGVACNFGMYKNCGDGICVSFAEDLCPGEKADIVEPPKDVEPEDTNNGCNGNWETCCKQGKIDQCCCPEGAACNFGWFTKCSDTTCTGPGQDCPDQPEKEPPKEE
jgi:hypothetical protein